MANPLTFLLPLRHDEVRNVLLIQSGPIDLALEVATRLRTLFPGCVIAAAVREADREAAASGSFERLTAVRWEDRFEAVRQLRRQRYDAVVLLLSRRGSDYLRMLPFLLRTRVILAFNDQLDYFPLNVLRLATLAHHLSGRASMGALVRWIAGRIVVLPLATLFLLVSTARLYARRLWRRARA